MLKNLIAVEARRETLAGGVSAFDALCVLTGPPYHASDGETDIYTHDHGPRGCAPETRDASEARGTVLRKLMRPTIPYS